MQYGYRLIPDVSEQRTIGMLREVEEDLSRRLRHRPAPPSVSIHGQVYKLGHKCFQKYSLYPLTCYVRRDHILVLY